MMKDGRELEFKLVELDGCCRATAEISLVLNGVRGPGTELLRSGCYRYYINSIINQCQTAALITGSSKKCVNT